MKERINIYRQHIRQQKYQQLAFEEHLRTYGNGQLHVSYLQFHNIIFIVSFLQDSPRK